MIQRIQSLFLLGSAIIAVALFFIPLSEMSLVNSAGQPYLMTLTVMEIKGEPADIAPPFAPKTILLIINLIILAASVYVIFLYKNRPAQMKLCALTGLFSVVLLVLAFYYSDLIAGEGGRPHYQAGVYLAAVQVFLLLAARRAIRKDEMLIRAADRIR